MRKELYTRRCEDHLCVYCATALGEGYTKKKCEKCLKVSSDYKKKTRSQVRAAQERVYRSSVWFKRCLYRARTTDALKERTEEGSYMTPKRLQTLRVLQLNKCFYCEKALQVDNRRSKNGLTVERLSNNKKHSLHNCVICCHNCNVRRLSNYHDIDIRDAYFTIIKKFEQHPVIYPKFLKLMESMEVAPRAC
jgi:hypothetical protein